MKPADPRNEKDHDAPDPVERAYRALEPEEPPELLDQAVLNRARRAVGGRRAWPWTLGWYHGLGTAAGVLLVVTVFLQMRQDAPKLPVPASLPSGAPAEEPVNASLERAQHLQKIGIEDRDENFEAGDLGASGRLQESAAGTAKREKLTVLSEDAADASAENLELDAVREQKNEPAPIGQDGFADFAEPAATVPAPVAREPMDYRADAEEQPARHRLEEARQAEFPLADEIETRAEGESTKARDSLEAEMPAPEDPAAPDDAEESRAGTRELMQQSLDAETWLERLAELKSAGDEDAFQAELEAFIAAYPDHPLPEGWTD